MGLGLKGLVTGIGSLPHKDAARAVASILTHAPHIPFWPQLPKRDIREGMVAQFSEGLPCLAMTPDGLSYDPRDRDDKLQEFYSHIIDGGDVDFFQISRDYATGFYAFQEKLEDLKKSKPAAIAKIKHIKLHITGPFSFAASIHDAQGVALLHDQIFFQAITQGLVMKALWQIKQFEGFGKSFIVFIDEPYLGCFGSAYTPLNRGEVITVLSDMSSRIGSAGKILVGVHCCGNTDWSIFTDVKTIDIINFDAFSFLDRVILYAEQLKGFLREGRTLCWGIVPTQEFSAQVTADLLVKQVAAGIGVLEKKGIPREDILKELCLSPACGLGTLDEAKAEAILGLLEEVGRLVGKTWE